MEIKRLTFIAETLNNLPEQERKLVLVLGHALNEINVLSKFIRILNNFDSETEILKQTNGCQSLLIVRTLIGKLYEAWNIFKNGYNSKEIGNKYSSSFNEETRDRLKQLNKYFGRKNLIARVRNEFSFHYELEHYNVQIPDYFTSEALSIYIGLDAETNFYAYAEYAAAIALQKILSNAYGKNPGEALEDFKQEVQQIIESLNFVSEALLFEIFKQHTDLEKREKKPDSIDIGSVPKLSELSIPFFFESEQPSSPSS